MSPAVEPPSIKSGAFSTNTIWMLHANAHRDGFIPEQSFVNVGFRARLRARRTVAGDGPCGS